MFPLIQLNTLVFFLAVINSELVSTKTSKNFSYMLLLGYIAHPVHAVIQSFFSSLKCKIFNLTVKLNFQPPFLKKSPFATLIHRSAEHTFISMIELLKGQGLH